MSDKITSVIARESNGNIQLTFTIPFALIQKAQDATIAEMAHDIEIPGFRKGNAPLSKVREKISQNELIEHSLSHLLPQALGDAIKEYNLKPAVYPKYELISAKEGEAWQIKGVTCELPEINLGDYKKEVAGALRASKIVLPGSDKKEPTKQEKEAKALDALLKSVKIEIPQILVEEEADSRLSSLLARLEKLGLALESYLASSNKKPEDLRAEYAAQAKEAISMDLILSKVAEVEGIKVTEEEISGALEMSEASKNQPEEDTENRKRLLESILKRRKALDFLISLE